MSVVSLSRRLLLSVVLASSAVACVPRATTGGAGAEAAQLESLQITTAQGVRRFRVEVVDDDAERTKGLMFRESLPADQGMLFDFGSPRPASFWMKNTLVPLDIVFIGEDGRVRNIGRDTIPFSEAPVTSSGAIRYALEINAGQAARLGIQPGDRVQHRLIPGG